MIACSTPFRSDLYDDPVGPCPNEVGRGWVLSATRSTEVHTMPQPKSRWRVLRATRPLSVLAPLAIVALALHPLSSPYTVTPLTPSPDGPAPDLVQSSAPTPSP